MKKLTFALACASTFALFAEIGAPKADFEKYTEETGWAVANKAEPGSQNTYWLYEGVSNSEDGSTVKAYGGDNLAEPTKDKDDNPGDKYLELSTEGGTLWRSLAEVKQTGDGGATLGDAHTIDPEKGLYIDTMVQFTPTEDGDSDGPKVDPSDKLAIWLNVDSSGGTPVTNLCVLGRAITTEGSGRNETPKATNTVFKLSGAQVDAGVWYRLTVKALKNIVTLDGDYIPGFIVMIDNVPMVIADNGKACDEKFLSYYEGSFTAGADDLITSGQFIPSLYGYQNEDVSALQAVGFKGSGALDNLAFYEDVPSPSPEDPIAVTPQITLSATEATFSDSLVLPTVTVEGSYVLDTDYTVTWSGELPTENPSEDVVLTVTVTMTGRYTGSATATFTVKPASTTGDDWKDVKDIPENAKAGTVYPTIPDTLKNADANKLTVWATDVGKVAFSDAAKINVDAFLLNVANDADETTINNAKAEFTLAITVDAKGTVTVTSPDPDGTKYNGKITIKGSKTVKDDYTLEMGANGEIPKDAKFFKAYLSVE